MSMKCSASFLVILCLVSSAVAQVDFNNPFTPDANTQGLWHFDEVTGSDTAYDATSNNNDGIIDPNATMYGYGPLDPDLSWAAGKFDTGTNTWLVSTADQNIGTLVVPQEIPGQGNSSLYLDGDFSIEFWMNAYGTSGVDWQDYILAKGTGSVYNIRYVDYKILLVWYGDGAWTSVADTTIIPLNEWHHVAITVDNTSVERKAIIKFFIDGVLSTEFFHDFFNDDANYGYDLTILGPPGGHPYNGFRGRLDELRISDIIRYPIPEPTTISLFVVALLALRRKK